MWRSGSALPLFLERLSPFLLSLSPFLLSLTLSHTYCLTDQVEKLQRRIAPHLLRRVKEDVAKDIPPKVRGGRPPT